MNSFCAWLVVALSLVAGHATAATTADGLVKGARARTTRHETYDGSYRQLAYPMGDVPDNTGVCTDLVIRAYRSVGVDLQVLIHQDMVRNFAAYPRTWKLPRPDRNIDHRRVPNMQVFFQRHGKRLPPSDAPKAYAPGDLVTWRLPGNLPHIGVVSNQFVKGTHRHKIIHNIGSGPVEDDILFRFPISGHYRYLPRQ